MKDVNLNKHSGSWVLSVRQTSDALSISERTCRMLISSGQLPIVQLSPRRIGILAEDLQYYLRARRA